MNGRIFLGPEYLVTPYDLNHRLTYPPTPVGFLRHNFPILSTPMNYINQGGGFQTRPPLPTNFSGSPFENRNDICSGPTEPYFLQRIKETAASVSVSTQMDNFSVPKSQNESESNSETGAKVDRQTQTESQQNSSNTAETVVSFYEKQLHLNNRYFQLEKELSNLSPSPEIDFSILNVNGPLSKDKIERSNQMNDILHVLKVKHYWNGKSSHTTNVFKSRHKKISKDNLYFDVCTIDLSRHKTQEKKGSLQLEPEAESNSRKTKSLNQSKSRC